MCIRDSHYGFINLSSALTADHVLFNSQYHQDSFYHEGLRLLKSFPDHNELDVIERIKEKSQVLYLGMNLSKFDQHKTQVKKNPLVLWNQRWEYDKNPESFFECLYQLQQNDIDFDIAVLGESFNTNPNVFDEAKSRLKKHIVHFGFCENFSEYAKWLGKADILPVTNNQDFFGGSVVEAIYCGVYPLLPNRLTYPELLPKEYHDSHIYNNDGDLYYQVKNCILNIDETRGSTIRKSFKKYDWGKMGPIYDELFSSFIN